MDRISLGLMRRWGGGWRWRPSPLSAARLGSAPWTTRRWISTVTTTPPPQLCFETTPPFTSFAPLQYPKPTIVMAMSGGVDSSASAALLMDAGFDVRPLYMLNWDELDETGACSGQQDAEDVRRTCRHLGLEYHQVEFVRDYWNQVFEPMLRGYGRGLTPNPDVLCNREIKFHAMLEYARQRMNVEWVATGHYARTQRVFAVGDGGGDQEPPYPSLASSCSSTESSLSHTLELLRSTHSHASSSSSSSSSSPYLVTTRLITALDPRKDQTYFLSHVRAPAFDHVLFPIGHLHKPIVREWAARFRLPTASKPDSMGLCFIGPRKFPDFLAQYVDMHTGDFVTLDGVAVGRHLGIERYTVGQSAHISGMARKWYVCEKRLDSREVVVVPDRFHPALLYDEVIIGDNMSWVSGVPPVQLRLPRSTDAAAELSESNVLDAYCRLRSTEAFRRCQVRARRIASSTASRVDAVEYVVRFVDGPHHTVSPGQTVALYVPLGEASEHERARAECAQSAEGSGTGYHGGIGLGMHIDFVCLGGGPLDRPGDSYMQQGRSWQPTPHYL